MFSVFQSGEDRYQPDPHYIYAADPQIRVDQRQLALFVGLTALGLPIILLFGSILGACFYDSISHYYYAQFWGDIFVGALVFIGTFLIAYRGENAPESLFATLAGLCAFAVAALPTSGRGCSLTEFSGRALADFKRGETDEFVTIVPASESGSFFELFTHASTWHFIAAGALFSFLAYYAFRIFTRVKNDQRDNKNELTQTKRLRNRIYHLSGWAILISMAALGLNAIVEFEGWDDYNMTFWFEALALWAFGFSWMVKGRWFFGLNIMDDEDQQDIKTCKAR